MELEPFRAEFRMASAASGVAGTADMLFKNAGAPLRTASPL